MSPRPRQPSRRPPMKHRTPKRTKTARKHRKHGGCVTGKVRYRSPQEATEALRRITTGEQIPGHVKPVRKYECVTCKGWHLTSMEEYP